MPDTKPKWVLSLSERVYKALLIAYPKEFRQAYEPQMALVFKDLCQEELRRGGMAGLGKLWVRTVLDLVATTLVERSSAHANDEEAIVRDNRLAMIGFVLLLAPLFFVAASILKYGVGLGLLFDPVNKAFLPAPESHHVFNQVATVVFLVASGLALALNSYAVLQLCVNKE